MIDYYCTELSKSEMEKLSPDEIAERISDGIAPSGCAIITNNYDTVYVMSLEDFHSDSRVVLYDPVFELEYFENGIPDWLRPKRGILYYHCSYSDGWTIEEDYRK